MSDEQIVVELTLEDGKYTGRMKNARASARAFEGDINRLDKGVTGVSRSIAGRAIPALRDWSIIIGQSRNVLHQLHYVTVAWTQSLVKTSAEVERLTFLMKGMSEASTASEKMKEATDNVQALFDAAKSAPFSMNALSDSFVKFKSVGLDPLDGSMESLVDAVAAFGGTDEVLGRASIAIQQMAGKGVISMEELRQQLGEAVPQAITVMAESMGVSYGELVDQISKGTVAAKPALEAMFTGFKMVFGGRAQSMMDTYNGRVAKMKTAWTEVVAGTPGIQRFFESQKDLVTNFTDLLSSAEFSEFADGVGNMISTVSEGLSWMISDFGVAYGKIKSFFTIVNEATLDPDSFVYHLRLALGQVIGFIAQTAKDFTALVGMVSLWASGMTEEEFKEKTLAERIKNGADLAEDEYDSLIALSESKAQELADAHKAYNDEIENLQNGIASRAGQMAFHGEKLVTAEQVSEASALFEQTKQMLIDADAKLKFREERYKAALNEVKMLEIDGSDQEKADANDFLAQNLDSYTDAARTVEDLKNQFTNLATSLKITAEEYGMTADELRNNLKPSFDEFGDVIPFTDDQIRELAGSADDWVSESANSILELKNRIEDIGDLQVKIGEVESSEFQEKVEDILEDSMGPIEEFQENMGNLLSDLRATNSETLQSTAGDEESRFAEAQARTVEFFASQAEALLALSAAAQVAMQQQGAEGIAAAAEMGAVVNSIIASFGQVSEDYLSGLRKGIVSVAPKKVSQKKKGKSSGAKAMENLIKLTKEAQTEADELARRFNDPFAYELPNSIDSAKKKIDGLAEKISGGKWTTAMKDLFDQMATNAMTEEMIKMAKATRDIERSLMGERDSRKAAYDEEVARIRKMKEKLVEMGIWRVEWEGVVQEQLLALQEQFKSESPMGEYLNEWKNIYEEIEQVGADTMRSLSQGMADMVTEGKADFADLARSAVNSLLQVSFNAGLSGLSSILKKGVEGWLGTPGGTSAEVNHSGGIVGQGSRGRSVDMSMFSNAARYHTGGVIGQEVPAILEKGEGVFTAAQMKALGSNMDSGKEAKVNIINNSGTQVEAEETNARFSPEGMVLDIVLKKVQQPGSFRDSMKRSLK